MAEDSTDEEGVIMASLKDHIRFLRDIREQTGDLAVRTGQPHAKLMRIYLESYLGARATFKEFLLFRLYEYPPHIRKQFLSLERCVRISNLLIADASPEDLSLIANKEIFNAYFRDWVRRDWLWLPDASPEDVHDFLQRHDRFLIKGNLTTQGSGIRMAESAGIDAAEFLRENEGKPLLLEELIRQHPDVGALNPGSVNTIRVTTAHYKGRTALIGGALRCGGAGAIVDNFTSGGVAYPLDMETGVVTAPGRDHDGRAYDRHPTTGITVPGFQVPFWDEIVQSVRTAAEMVPRVGYIGWDIAVTDHGPEFVEGNVDVPGPTLIQLDKPDAYGRLARFLKECDSNPPDQP